MMMNVHLPFVLNRHLVKQMKNKTMNKTKAYQRLSYIYFTYLKTLAGSICPAGAASIMDCQVLVESGITKPNSKNHSKIKVIYIANKAQ